MAEKKNVRDALSQYLIEHVGKVVHVNTIMEVTGLSKTQVQGGMISMRNRGVRVEVEIPAHAWIYRGGPAGQAATEVPVIETTSSDVVQVVDTRGTLYEEIGRTREGAPILQDADGVLYIAKEIN